MADSGVLRGVGVPLAALSRGRLRVGLDAAVDLALPRGLVSEPGGVDAGSGDPEARDERLVLDSERVGCALVVAVDGERQDRVPVRAVKYFDGLSDAELLADRVLRRRSDPHAPEHHEPGHGVVVVVDASLAPPVADVPVDSLP